MRRSARSCGTSRVRRARSSPSPSAAIRCPTAARVRLRGSRSGEAARDRRSFTDVKYAGRLRPTRSCCASSPAALQPWQFALDDEALVRARKGELRRLPRHRPAGAGSPPGCSAGPSHAAIPCRTRGAHRGGGATGGRPCRDLRSPATRLPWCGPGRLLRPAAAEGGRRWLRFSRRALREHDAVPGRGELHHHRRRRRRRQNCPGRAPRGRAATATATRSC